MAGCYTCLNLRPASPWTNSSLSLSTDKYPSGSDAALHTHQPSMAGSSRAATACMHMLIKAATVPDNPLQGRPLCPPLCTHHVQSLCHNKTCSITHTHTQCATTSNFITVHTHTHACHSEMHTHHPVSESKAQNNTEHQNLSPQCTANVSQHNRSFAGGGGKEQCGADVEASKEHKHRGV